ncbi:MAG: type II toxin-antitoxin system RelE/ParE family toxin [Ignavibacteriales bacterium]|nr:MAG: type II toxin-antitoxin system RelE/ParE family toxin [Ignavibacteriales bacterium]
MKIIWSPLAAERLDRVYEFIAEDNLPAAKKMVDRIIKRIDTLSKNPERGRKVPETNREEIREVFEGEYRIIYRMESGIVHILTIRNFKQVLLPKDIK